MNQPKLDRDIASFLFDNISNDNLATEEERFLAENLKAISSISKIKTSDIPTLKHAFQNASSGDAYSISPTYYALTGRRGLWLSKYTNEDGEKTVCIFCLHPNIKNTIVIFPPFGNEPSAAINSLISEIGNIGINFQIGRVNKKSNIMEEINDRINFTTKIKRENVLDWTFPVHTIDCSDLMERKGKKYARIRQVMNKFNGMNPSIRKVDFINDLPLIKSLSTQWEGNTSHYDNYDVDSNKYFETLADVAYKEPRLGLDGIIISINGVDRGFSIWESAPNKGGIANLFASQVVDFDMTNLSTYLTVKSAEYALNNGAKHMCLGGSENEGMDRYKRGFIPDQSEELVTFEIVPV